jgi:hypothetical protein
MTSIAGQATTDQYRIGLIIGRNTDVGVNIAGQQDPANPELDWMHIDRVIPTASGATVDSTQHWVIDNHSKRKMQELNQAYLLCLQQNAAAARTFNLYCRTLIALP